MRNADRKFVRDFGVGLGLAAALTWAITSAHAQVGPQPGGQCPGQAVHAHASGSTGIVSASLPSPGAGLRNYLCGWDVSGVGTSAAIGPITITNTQTNNIIVQLATVLAAGVTASASREYGTCIPSVSLNQAITVSTTADANATAVDVDVHGCAY